MPTSGREPLVVTFSDASTGDIKSRSWDFGDGGTTNITTNSVVHTYTAGTYPVTLIVSGAGGVDTNTQASYITANTAYQSWQIQYFGSTGNPDAAPSADADGTGQNNLFKYVAGLDPTKSDSVFVLNVTGVPNVSTQQVLTFFPVADGRTYTPVFSTDLSPDGWTPLTGYDGPVTNGSQVTITDLDATQSNKFYRIRITYPF